MCVLLSYPKRLFCESRDLLAAPDNGVAHVLPPFTLFYDRCAPNTGRRAPGSGKAATIGSARVADMADKGFRAHLQFPSTKWELLADASVRGEQSPAALDEFANR